MVTPDRVQTSDTEAQNHQLNFIGYPQPTHEKPQ